MYYSEGNALNWTGNPYDSSAWVGSVDYGSSGIFSSSALMLAHSPAFAISTATHGFYGGTFGGMRGMARYASGKNADFIQARKYGNISWAGRRYSNLAQTIPGLASIAPTLSHLGPTRFFTLWSALSGNEDAYQALAAMRELRIGAGIGSATAAEDIGKAYTSAFKRKPWATFKGARKTDFRDFALRDGVKWGSVIDGPAAAWVKGRMAQLGNINTVPEGIRSTISDDFLRETGYLDGKLSSTYGRWMMNMNEKALAGKASGKAFMAAGKAIKPLAGIATKALAGVDVYGLSLFAGSMVGKMTIGALGAPINTYTALTTEMHRGIFMSSSSLSPNVGATGRQRAMANVYDKQLNLRQVLGNEAPYLANWGL